MSAMPEESDVDTEEEAFVGSESDGVAGTETEVQHEERPEGTSLTIAEILQEDDEPGGQELLSKSNGNLFRGYRGINKDESPLADESSELDLRQGMGRPSSADGSPITPDDIPDDTPSLKV